MLAAHQAFAVSIDRMDREAAQVDNHQHPSSLTSKPDVLPKTIDRLDPGNKRKHNVSKRAPGFSPTEGRKSGTENKHLDETETKNTASRRTTTSEQRDCGTVGFVSHRTGKHDQTDGGRLARQGQALTPAPASVLSAVLDVLLPLPAIRIFTYLKFLFPHSFSFFVVQP